MGCLRRRQNATSFWRDRRLRGPPPPPRSNYRRALGEGSDPGPDSKSRYPDPEFEMSYGVYITCTLQVYYRTYSYMYLIFNTLYFSF